MRKDILPSLPFPSHSPRRRRLVATIVVVFSLGAFGIARAIEGVTFALDAVSGTGWSAAGLQFDVALGPEGLRGNATIRELRLADGEYAARDIAVECHELEIAAGRIACLDGRVSANTEELGAQNLRASVTYDRASSDLEFALADLAIAGGTAQLDAALRERGWQAEVELDDADLASLGTLLARLGLAPDGIAITAGSIDLDMSGSGQAQAVRTLEFDVAVRGVSAGNEAGTVASDAVDLNAHGTLQNLAGGWRYALEFAAPRGQAYVEPVFLDLASGAIEASATGALADGGIVNLERFDLHHHESVRAHGRASLRLGEEIEIVTLEADVTAVRLPGAWQAYAAPFLLDTSLANLDTQGELAGRIQIVDGLPQLADLTLRSVAMDDGKGAFAIAGLSGELHWTAPESTADVEDEESVVDAPPASTLAWQSGSLFGLELGATRLRFTARGRGLRLTEPATVPVLDGAIDIDAFRIRNFGTERVAFLVGAEIRPISVARLARAFGWPEFGGTLAGTIKKLRMREGVVSLGTTLAAQVFDGEIRLSDLRLERPFGDWPRLFVNVDLEGLDLEQVTSAFAFGRITGRLGGRIEGLELFNWMPVAFDARLETPADDRSRHRISQRAVENIGSLGGSGAGVTAALSSGFLQFFEDFNYDKLGITCRLRNEVCQMGGVAPAEGGGYYLVKGKGIPRIDVIGNRRRVDWPRLVRQLIAITEAEGPIVQ